jgi:hypothetical protein
LSKDVLALLYFYAAIAIAVLFLIVVEAYLGMFTGLSGTEALLKATGVELSAHASEGASAGRWPC